MKNSRNNPWLGLRSYTENDHIYGRDKEIEELSQKIIYNAQTVIYGKSGIGKSSLLNAGVFPVLRRHNFFPVYVRLLHDGDRADYALQLATAVKSALSKLKIEDLGADEGERIRPVKGYLKVVVPAADPAHEGMWEFFHRHHFCYRDSEGWSSRWCRCWFLISLRRSLPCRRVSGPCASSSRSLPRCSTISARRS